MGLAAIADRLFNACVVLYGAAVHMEFGPHETDAADLRRRVIARAEDDLGPDLLAKVEEAMRRRVLADYGIPDRQAPNPFDEVGPLDVDADASGAEFL